MENLKLIIDKITADLSLLEAAIDNKITLSRSLKANNDKKLDDKTIMDISSNLDRLDEIIRVLDEDNKN